MENLIIGKIKNRIAKKNKLLIEQPMKLEFILIIKLVWMEMEI
jgi:hypothetical protein